VSSPSGDIRVRLSWAKQQLEALDLESTRVLSKTYRVIGEPYGDSTDVWRYLVKVVRKGKEPPFADWAFMAGDIAHNLHASLDNLAWALAGRFAHGGTAFPLTDCKEKWAQATHSTKRHKAKTYGMGATVVNIVHGFQPYTDRKNFQLGVLRDLSNEDKHRIVQLTAVAGFLGSVGFGKVRGPKMLSVPYVRPAGSFQDDTVLGRVEVSAGVKVKPHVTLEVAFAEGTVAAYRPVLTGLRGVTKMIETEILPALEGYIPAAHQ